MAANDNHPNNCHGLFEGRMQSLGLPGLKLNARVFSFDPALSVARAMTDPSSIHSFCATQRLVDGPGVTAPYGTQQSIQKVVGYVLQYFSKCGEDP